MSESTVSIPATQEQSTTTPAVQVPEDTTLVPAAAEGPSKADIRKADKLADAVEKCYAKAVAGLATQLVKTGGLVDEFLLHWRFTLNRQRSGGIKLLRGRLEMWDDCPSHCDVGLLQAGYHIVRLLSGGSDAWQKSLPWTKLVTMQGLVYRDDETEVYTIKPGVDEARARAVFTEAVGNEDVPPLPRADLTDRVLELVNPEKYQEKQALRRREEEDRKELARRNALTPEQRAAEDAERAAAAKLAEQKATEASSPPATLAPTGNTPAPVDVPLPDASKPLDGSKDKTLSGDNGTVAAGNTPTTGTTCAAPTTPTANNGQPTPAPVPPGNLLKPPAQNHDTDNATNHLNLLKAVSNGTITLEQAAELVVDIILATGKPDTCLDRIHTSLYKDFPEELSHKCQRAVAKFLSTMHKNGQDKPQDDKPATPSPQEVAAALANSGQTAALVANSPAPERSGETGIVVVAPGADSPDAGDNDRAVPVTVEAAEKATTNGVAVVAA